MIQYPVFHLQFRLLLDIVNELCALVCLGLISQNSPQDLPASRFGYDSTSWRRQHFFFTRRRLKKLYSRDASSGSHSMAGRKVCLTQ